MNTTKPSDLERRAQAAGEEIYRIQNGNGIVVGDAPTIYANAILRHFAQSTPDKSRQELVGALRGMTEHYCALINSGDCGNWNPEADAPVIAARAALKNAE